MEIVTSFQIYLFGLLLNLKSDTAFLALFMFWVIIGLSFLYALSKDKYIDILKGYSEIIVKWLKRAVITFVCLVLTCALAPTKEIATAMFIVPPVVNNEKVQELPSNVLDFVNGWLKEHSKNTKEF